MMSYSDQDEESLRKMIQMKASKAKPKTMANPLIGEGSSEPAKYQFTVLQHTMLCNTTFFLSNHIRAYVENSSCRLTRLECNAPEDSGTM